MNLLNKFSFRKELVLERSKNKKLNVVITGGTRGLGRGFAEEFTNYNDNVYIMSRNQKDIDEMVDKFPKIKGICGDVKKKADIIKVVESIDNIDVWINNAGSSGGSRSLMDLSDEKMVDIINTNLVGTCNACKIVHDVMKNQSTGGAIFNLAGAGSDGSATPNYPVYGATKAGIVQLSKSLQKEWENTNVDVHVISPGMMLTDLLTDNLNVDTLEIIEFLCSHPDIVALHLVPRIRAAYYKDENEYIRFLTILRILGKVLMKVKL